jgi:hypothetical protein
MWFTQEEGLAVRSARGFRPILTPSCPGSTLLDHEEIAMPPQIAPIDATLGAVVTGLDLSRMDALTWKTVEQAFHEYAVLVFPAPGLSPEAQVRQSLRGYRAPGSSRRRGPTGPSRA